MKGLMMRVASVSAKTKSRMSMLMTFVFVVTTVLCLTVVTFAADEPAVTTVMLEPVLEGVKANIAVILPIGVALFAIVLGIKFIPRIFKMFSKG